MDKSGYFVYIKDLKDKENRRVDLGPPAGQCPFIDDMMRRKPNSDESFECFVDAIKYLNCDIILRNMDNVPKEKQF